MRPFDQGVADARNKLPNSNPFKAFTHKWKEYNKGHKHGTPSLMGPPRISGDQGSFPTAEKM